MSLNMWLNYCPRTGASLVLNKRKLPKNVRLVVELRWLFACGLRFGKHRVELRILEI